MRGEKFPLVFKIIPRSKIVKLLFLIFIICNNNIHCYDWLNLYKNYKLNSQNKINNWINWILAGGIAKNIQRIQMIIIIL